jgi:hypothetical protein
MSKGQWKKVGEIGVDAGLVMVGDPCYVLGDDASQRVKSWSEFCDSLGNDYPTVKDMNFGFVVSSGYGDGLYPVYVKKNAEGRVIGLKVEFD